MNVASLLIELQTEELPPKALPRLGEFFASSILKTLVFHGVVDVSAAHEVFASPRRLAVLIENVRAFAPDRLENEKLVPLKVAYGEDGKASPALIKKLTKLLPIGSEGEALETVLGQVQVRDGFTYFVARREGITLSEAVNSALRVTIDGFPSPKRMTYQEPDGKTLAFVRPAHGLVALHGTKVLSQVTVLGLPAGNRTNGHRFEATVNPVQILDAESYAATLQANGAVIASFDARRAEIVQQLEAAAAKVGGGAQPIDDDALLDEVTALVERPNVLVCSFEPEFLEVPQECLILTMKANQKYFPLLDAQAKLTNKFLVVSNITPDDASAVIQGNERVVRPRLADAKFFFDQDRKKSLASRVESLGKVVYHNKLGTQGERVQRVMQIAGAIAQKIGGASLAAHATQAAQLAKADLVTDMVGEFPELQGTMGRYYALHDGLDAAVADAIEDHYKPRFAGDALPRNPVGLVVALADKLETLVGMFGIGNLPTGDRDPFALRRHALGVIRMLIEKDLPVELNQLLSAGFGSFFLLGVDSEDRLGGLAANQLLTNDQYAPFEHQVEERKALLEAFIYDRLAGSLREQGASAQEVDAVLAPLPQRLGEVPKLLAAVRAFAALPAAAALAAANKRIGNILKKAPEADAHVSELLLQEPAEKALHAAMAQVVPAANAQFDAGDYTGSLQTLAALREPVDAFFTDVMVNAEQADLRLNRLGLLMSLHSAMNRVAQLERLAV